MDELIRYLKERNIIKTKKVENALRNTPFTNFVPKNQVERFLFDTPVMFPTLGRNISAPHMNVIMLELLNLDFDDNLLIIGSKMGYFATLASQIIEDGNIEIIDASSLVVAQTRRNLERIKMEKKITVVNSQPLEGDIENSPWDRVLITASVEEVSLDLLAQLKVGGSIFAPMGDMRKQELIQRFRQTASLNDTDFLKKSWGSVVFGPLDTNLDMVEVGEEELLDENEFSMEYSSDMKSTENLTFFCPICQFEFMQIPLSLKTASKKVTVNYKIQCPSCKNTFSLTARLNDKGDLELTIE